jgi:UTP--glucose-1-phosphate uridylyltransferase
MSRPGLEAARETMVAAGVNPIAISVFERFYRQLEAEVTGFIPESTIEPMAEVARLDDLSASAEELREALARTVVLKLNGGLGTSMGITGPKSVLSVRDGLTFLDITARQILDLRTRYGVDIPLLLMNSFRTRAESLQVLERYPTLAVGDLPVDFVQSPRVCWMLCATRVFATSSCRTRTTSARPAIRQSRPGWRPTRSRMSQRSASAP